MSANPAAVDTLVAAFDILKPKIEALRFSTASTITKRHVKSYSTFAMEICVTVIPLIAAGYMIRNVMSKMDPEHNKKQEAAMVQKQLIAKLAANGRKLSSPIDQYEQTIITDVMLPSTLNVTFSDIGGLNDVKQDLYETIILPLQSPELFTAMSHNTADQPASSSLLSSPRGVLFYGPPGTGKTMMAKAIAKTCSATFINVRLSTLQNKWYGESQKLVRAVFSLAVKLAPTIIFIDEIDLFMHKRGGNEHEATGTMKAEFMSLWDGLTTSEAAQVTVLGCTNRPFDIDEAILRRMPRSFLYDLPDVHQRVDILKVLLRDQVLDSSVNIQSLAEQTNKYSGSDLKELCRYAAMIPVRELLKSKQHLTDINALNNSVLQQQAQPIKVDSTPVKPRPISVRDFEHALQNVEPTGQSALEYSKHFQQFHNSKASGSGRNSAAGGFGNQDADSVVDKFVEFISNSNSNTPQQQSSRSKQARSSSNKTGGVNVD